MSDYIACWGIVHVFCCLLLFSKNSFSNSNTIRVTNNLGPDSVGPDLGPNCLQRL